MKLLPVLLVLLALVPASSKEAEPIPDDKLLKLDPLKIHENAIISFALDIVIYVDPQDRKVSHIFITKVAHGSDAEKAGLQPGDEIVKLDGEPVKGQDPRVLKDSPLGRLLLNRSPSEFLKFEIIAHRTQEFTLRAQRDLLPIAR